MIRGVLVKILLVYLSVQAHVIEKNLFTADVNYDLSDQHPEVMPGLFEGDIALSDEDYQNLKVGVNFEKFPLKKWPNRTVPYFISEAYSSLEAKEINIAVKYLNEMSCLKFLPREKQKDYVHIVPRKYPPGCFSGDWKLNLIN